MPIDMHQDFKTCSYFTLAKLKREAECHVNHLNHVLSMAHSGFLTPDMEMLRIQTISTKDFCDDVRSLVGFYTDLINLCKFKANNCMVDYTRQMMKLIDSQIDKMVQHDLVVVEAYVTYQNSYSAINRCNTTMQNTGRNCEALSLVRPLRLIKKFLEYCFLRCTKSLPSDQIKKILNEFSSGNHENPLANYQSTQGAEKGDNLSTEELKKVLTMCSTLEQVHDLIIENMRQKCSQFKWEGLSKVWSPPEKCS